MMNPRFVARAWIISLLTAAALVSGHGGAIVAMLVIATIVYALGVLT